MLKEGDVQGALECYAEALWLLQDPERKPEPKLRAVLHANRSSCLMTLATANNIQSSQQWNQAVLEAEKAIIACPSYEKGYHRLVSAKLRAFTLPGGCGRYVPALRDCWKFGARCAALAELAVCAEAACDGLLSLDSIFLPPQLPAQQLADLCSVQNQMKAVLWSHWRATGPEEAVPTGLQMLPQDILERILHTGLIEPRGFPFAAELAEIDRLPIVPDTILQLTLEHNIPAAGKCTIAAWNRELQRPLCEHVVLCRTPPLLEIFRVVVKAILSPFDTASLKGRPQYVCFSGETALFELKPLLAYCSIAMVAKVEPDSAGFENSEQLWLLRVSGTPIMRIRGSDGLLASFSDGADPNEKGEFWNCFE